MPRTAIPEKMIIGFVIEDENQQLIHEGTFRMDIDQERRVFTERSLDALINGYYVHTYWDNKPQ